MKKFPLLLVFLSCLPLPGNGQGTFLLSTSTARTRIGSTNGPLAGPGIWGQALAGFTADSLTPVGFPSEHWTNGLVGVNSSPFHSPLHSRRSLCKWRRGMEEFGEPPSAASLWIN